MSETTLILDRDIFSNGVERQIELTVVPTNGSQVNVIIPWSDFEALHKRMYDNPGGESP